MAVSKPRCAAEVAGLGGFHWHPCKNPGKIEHDGKSWCGVHDPIKKAGHARERREKWDRAFAHRMERHKAADAYPTVLAERDRLREQNKALVEALEENAQTLEHYLSEFDATQGSQKAAFLLADKLRQFVKEQAREAIAQAREQ